MGIRGLPLLALLPLVLGACASAPPTSGDGEACPALFPVPTLTVSPMTVPAGSPVTITVRTLRPDEACYAYRVDRAETLVDGQLLESRAVDNSKDGTFVFTWTPRAGQNGLAPSLPTEIQVSARVRTGATFVPARTNQPGDPPGEAVTVRVTSP